LLEKADRIAIAIVEVTNAGLLIGRGKGDRRSTGWQTPTDRNPGNDRGEVGLFKIEHRGSVAGGCHASLLPGHRLSQVSGTEKPEGSDAGRNHQG
jgi:hypothetical protein